MKITFMPIVAFILVTFIITENALAQELIAAWPQYNSFNPVGGHPATATAKHALITAPTMNWKSQFILYNDNAYFYVSPLESTPTPAYKRYMYTKSLANGVTPPDTADDYMTFTFSVPVGYELSLTKLIIRPLHDETNLRLYLRSSTDNYRYDLISSYYNQRSATQINTNYINMDNVTGKLFTVYTTDINFKSSSFSTFDLRLYVAMAASKYVYFYCVNMKYSSVNGGGNAYPNPYPTYADYMVIFEGSLTSIYYADGSGDGSSEEQAFLIQTKEHLYNVRFNPGSHFKQTADISFAESDFQLGGVYYNKGAGWNPIGNSTANFTGSYNGQGHTISGLKISDPTGTNIGLFGYTGGTATIKNLGLLNVNIVGNANVGGLTGYYNGSGTVSQCFVQGSVTGNSSTGGFIGLNSTTIQNCYSMCTVSAAGSSIGGFIGSHSLGTVSLSYSASTVTTGGGFAGSSADTVQNNCLWNNELTVAGVVNNPSGYFNGVGKTTSEMKTSATFSSVGWDLTGNLWKIDNTQTINSGYPFLAWQSSSGAPLPVELTSFTAAIDNGKVLLNWKTETETNNYGFEIERAIDIGQSIRANWKSVGFVIGSGNSNSCKVYNFLDPHSYAPNVHYRLKQIDNDGKVSYSKVIELKSENVPTEFSLSQNYPNPFNPSTVISYQVAVNCTVSLKLFDMLGNEIAVLVDKEQTAGSYNFPLSIVNYPLSSGVYLYQLRAGEFVCSKKLILMK